MALVKKTAAIHIGDAGAEDVMITTAVELLDDKERMKMLSENILDLAVPDSAQKICEEIRSLMN